MPTNEDAGSTNTETTNTTNNETQKVTFEELLKAQPEEFRKAYEEHVTGLKNTVSATRKERDDFSKQLRDAVKGLEEGSKLKGELTALAGKLEEANARALFYETAPGMDCRNPKAAFALMTSLGLTTRSGDPDWKAIKENAPELFGKVVANANAGAGTDELPPSENPNAAMNQFIRNKGRSA